MIVMKRMEMTAQASLMEITSIRFTIPRVMRGLGGMLKAKDFNKALELSPDSALTLRGGVRGGAIQLIR